MSPLVPCCAQLRRCATQRVGGGWGGRRKGTTPSPAADRHSAGDGPDSRKTRPRPRLAGSTVRPSLQDRGDAARTRHAGREPAPTNPPANHPSLGSEDGGSSFAPAGAVACLVVFALVVGVSLLAIVKRGRAPQAAEPSGPEAPSGLGRPSGAIVPGSCRGRWPRCCLG
jgi:hypothetical protein